MAGKAIFPMLSSPAKPNIDRTELNVTSLHTHKTRVVEHDASASANWCFAHLQSGNSALNYCPQDVSLYINLSVYMTECCKWIYMH